MKFLQRLLIPACLWIIFILILTGTNLISVKSPLFAVTWILFALYLLVSSLSELKSRKLFAVSKISFSVIVFWLFSNGIFGQEGIILAESGDTIYKYLSSRGTFEELEFDIIFEKADKEFTELTFARDGIRKEATLNKKKTVEFFGFKFVQTGFDKGIGTFKLTKLYAKPVIYFAYLVFFAGIAVFTFRVVSSRVTTHHGLHGWHGYGKDDSREIE